MIYVISHTHWDREWLVTSEYTNEWLPDLFKRLVELFERDSTFEFVLDGQTLILEDLKSVDQDLYDKVIGYAKSGNLKVGPSYAQIDWRISIPQAIWKNFEIGMKDCEDFGCFKVGWFMDNFGQISQLPQILKLFGIDFSFVWRGIRETFPYFGWRSPDGSEVNAMGLIGGYRTLYNLTDTRDIAEERMKHEFDKLSRFGLPVVLLDGYDLDVHPENPKEILDGNFSTSIEDLIDDVQNLEKPVIEGELLSGKIASIFPGTLSTRTYLKLGADFMGKLLTTLDFLKSTFGDNSEEIWREYLKTLIHDNICGVGVDQVHDKMEKTYERLYKMISSEMREYLEKLPLNGVYTFSPSRYHGYFPFGNSVYRLDSDGVGLWKVKKYDYAPTQGVGNFQPFEIVLEKEDGDAYSSCTKDIDFDVNIISMERFSSEVGERHVIKRRVSSERAIIDFEETYDVFENSIWLKALIKPRGCCYKLYYSFDKDEEIYAGMPFDIVKRGCEDFDLFPEEETLGGILLAAREIGKIEEFPMQDFLILKGERINTIAVKGLRSYVCRGEKLLIPLVRSVEWITRKVCGRYGDAGPEMYVPGARCEREITVQIVLLKDLSSFEKIRSFSRFVSWPKMIVRASGGTGTDLEMFPDGTLLPGLKVSGRKIERFSYGGINTGRSKVSLELETLPYGEDMGKPDEDVLTGMEEKMRLLKKTLRDLENILKEKSGLERVKLEHTYWTNMRRYMETKLSLLLNEEKLGKNVSSEIRDVAKRLNEVRRKKRTFDYILEFWEARS